MSNINYMAVEPDSQFYTDLSQLLQTMKYLKMNKTILSARAVKNSVSAQSREEEIDYIIKGLENTIDKGYKINEPVPEGYQRIDVKEGAIVLSPENAVTLQSTHRPSPDLSNMEDLLRYSLRQTTESLSETNRIRGEVSVPDSTGGPRPVKIESNLNKAGDTPKEEDYYPKVLGYVGQKEALIDIIRDDERDNLYDTPRCGVCNGHLTLVRPGKWQCDTCGF